MINKRRGRTKEGGRERGREGGSYLRALRENELDGAVGELGDDGDTAFRSCNKC